MIGFGKLTFLAGLLFCVCISVSANSVVQFGSIKIRLSLEASPLVVRSGGSSGAYASGGAVFANKRWLAVQVSYVPGVVPLKNIVSGKTKNTGNIKSIQPLHGRWLDDVTLRVCVAFPTENARRSNAVYGLFEGKTTFWSIRLDAKRRNVLMFVPPQLLDRYASPAISGRREVVLTPAEYRVMAEFTDSKGNVLGRHFFYGSQGKNNLQKAFFDTIKDSPGSVYIRGAVLPKSKTPWAWHAPATFDYIKDTASDKSEKQ